MTESKAKLLLDVEHLLKKYYIRLLNCYYQCLDGQQ